MPLVLPICAVLTFGFRYFFKTHLYQRLVINPRPRLIFARSPSFSKNTQNRLKRRYDTDSNLTLSSYIASAERIPFSAFLFLVKFGVIFVHTPLEDVARHVVQAVIVRRILTNRCRFADVAAVIRAFFIWILIAPWKTFPRQTTAGGKLPLRFGRESFAHPFAVCHRVVPTHANNGLIRLI